MTDRQRRIRIGILTGSHLLLGLIMVPVAASFPGLQQVAWIVVWYMGFVCCEILLFGMWMGFSTSRWWIKLVGLLAAMAWLGALSLAPIPNSLDQAPIIMALAGGPLLVVAGSCGFCRRWFAKLECRNGWNSLPVLEELQFSLKSVISLTVVVAVLLAVGRFMQWIDPRIETGIGIVFIISVFALTAVLATGMLVWASLGPGQAIVRVPIVTGAMILLGLLPPYSMGGPAFRYFVWISVMAVVAVCTAGSLLVVRSCGYRLIRLRDVENQPELPAQQCS